MFSFMIALAIAAVTTMVVLRFMHPVAEKIGLIDHPKAHKLHQTRTPLIGGIAIFAGTAVAISSTMPLVGEIRLYLLAAATLVFVGVLDDRYDLSVRSRFVGHLIAASIIIFGGQLYFQSLGNLLGFGEVKMSMWGVVFTYLAVMAAINAYNMIDGIDGLLGSQAAVTFAAIAWLTASAPTEIQANTIAIILLVSLVPFLVVNLRLLKSTRKVFMGDAGSMFIGLTIVWLFIMTTQSETYALESGVIVHENAVIRPVTALWLVAIPVMDMVYVIWRRMVTGQNPVRSDQRHIHHLFHLVGFSNSQTVAIMLAGAVVMAALGILGEWLLIPEWQMLVGYLLAYAVYTRIVKKLKQLAGHERVHQAPE